MKEKSSLSKHLVKHAKWFVNPKIVLSVACTRADLILTLTLCKHSVCKSSVNNHCWLQLFFSL